MAIAELPELFAGQRQGPHADPLVIWDIFACEERARAWMQEPRLATRQRSRKPVLMFR